MSDAVEGLDRGHERLGPDRRHQHPIDPLHDKVFDDRHLSGRHVLGVGRDHLHAQFLGLILDVFLEADEERMGQGGDRQTDDDLLLPDRPAAGKPETQQQGRND